MKQSKMVSDLIQRNKKLSMRLKQSEEALHSFTNNFENISRFEVIDGEGRQYVRHLKPVKNLMLSFQDDNRTLKVLID